LKIVVYVEGDGDRLCLETLLDPLLKLKAASGVSIQFVSNPRGDSKKALLTKFPESAARTILNNPQILVVILPDLYPRNKGFRHETCEEMQTGVLRRFNQEIKRRHGSDDRLADRFRVFCLIHDLEVLLLAAEEQLLPACGLTAVTWTKPVEQQNHDNPPKEVVKKLIPTYQPTVDGPRILAGADYHLISSRCPRGFGQFVAFLESVNA
jgi:Domain of unknown function (DUF4276)